ARSERAQRQTGARLLRRVLPHHQRSPSRAARVRARLPAPVMTGRAAVPLLARLAVYYAALAGVALYVAPWLPLPHAGTPAVVGPLGRPGAAAAAALGMLGALTLVIPVAWTY